MEQPTNNEQTRQTLTPNLELRLQLSLNANICLFCIIINLTLCDIVVEFVQKGDRQLLTPAGCPWKSLKQVQHLWISCFFLPSELG